MSRLFLLWLAILLPVSSLASTLSQLESEIAQKKFSAAAANGTLILKKQPDNLQVRFLTALALQNTNQVAQAEQHYLYLIKNHPEFPEPRNNLAMIYMQRGQHDEAAGLLIASLKTHPAYAIAWKNLSDLYKGLAGEAYRKALGEESPVSALDNIQLSAIDKLYSLPQTKPVQIAMVTAPAKPAMKISPQNVIPIKPEIKKAGTKTEPKAIEAQAKTASMSTLADNPKQALIQWAQAWSDKNLKRYLSAYTPDFKGQQKSHQQWVDIRQKRINRPGDISVTLSNIVVKSRSADRITIDAHQAYQSLSYQDRVVKRFNLTKINGNWKISRERTLAVL